MWNYLEDDQNRSLTASASCVQGVDRLGIRQVFYGLYTMEVAVNALFRPSNKCTMLFLICRYA